MLCIELSMASLMPASPCSSFTSNASCCFTNLSIHSGCVPYALEIPVLSHCGALSIFSSFCSIRSGDCATCCLVCGVKQLDKVKYDGLSIRFRKMDYCACFKRLWKLLDESNFILYTMNSYFRTVTDQ